MADDDVRALFHRIDDGPPLGIDVHEVMSRGRRVRTRRAVLAAAGSTVAVAVAAVIGLTTGGDVQAPEILRPADPPTTSTGTPENQPPPPPSNGATAPSSNPPANSAPAPENMTPPGNTGPTPEGGPQPPAGTG